MSADRPMRRLSDFKPTAAVVGMIESMPLPSDAEINSIVAALRERLKPHARLRYAALALADVQDAIDDAEPAPEPSLDLSCEACAGSGGERARCGECAGRGLVLAFSAGSAA